MIPEQDEIVALKKLAECQASVCRVFACSRRILILWVLASGEQSVTDIACQIGASLQNTSQHLQLMKKMGFVTSRREAQTIYYGLADTDTAVSCHLLSNARSAQTDG